MPRSLKYEIPGEDWRRTTVEAAVEGMAELFSPQLERPFEMVLEIGFGRGEFLLDLAAKEPCTAFLGVEVSFKRTLKMARKLARAGFDNVRLFEARGQVVVKDLIRKDSLREIWINFSDPWPKDRHAGRRLIQPDFVRDAALCLVSGGTLHVATDDVPYAEQIDPVLASEPLLENAFAPERWLCEVPGRMHTGYEVEWREAGRPLHFFAYRRRVALEEG
ncbi:MAG: tRNA (guanosine(46)-N7)-methyltransferase TrmB [Deltaproteobacteria bacterium]|nr:tRNA (guanosine(46)-N7)-methyltransferase TrmB [Deltaproteobacteria bacterium]MBW2382084.1 tRNA (guanosine(46)-N7)-methyltransferase TrmB [Deltaproteobacteria bacterium]MBW2695708.1 tRNA (guanosine(46)-N7)-methyltransferase TrmB [Deltaproteobacteria bacterium]